MESQKTLNSQSNLEKEEQIRRHHVHWFQTMLQNCINQDSMVPVQKQTIDPWNRIVSPEISLHLHDQYIYDREARVYSWCLNSVGY